MMARALLAGVAFFALGVSLAHAQQVNTGLGSSVDEGVNVRGDDASTRTRSMQRDRQASRTITVPGDAVVLPAIAGIDLAGSGPAACKASEKARSSGHASDAATASHCLSGLVQEWVRGFAPGWPSNADPWRSMPTAQRYARQVTAANLVLVQWARETAQDLAGSDTINQDEAEGEVVKRFTAAAPALFDRYMDLRHELEASPVEIRQDSSCRYGWVIGPNSFCGDKGSMEISRAGAIWASAGVLAGARVELALAERGTVSNTRTVGTTTTTSGTTGTGSNATVRAAGQ